ncbi:MAG: DNA ligase [Xanthobacteraceae bacterium]
MPRPAEKPPSGPEWIHEIKHDGFRLMSYRDASGVRLITRNGRDFSDRFPSIRLAAAALTVQSCIIDGEVIACDDNGFAIFELIRTHRTVAWAVHCAFDLLELNGEDLRQQPIEVRKQILAKLLHGCHRNIVFNLHFDGDGAIIYKHACGLGCEGIVSKRLGSPYQAGRSAYWLKIKNPAAPAGKREAEEELRK